MIIALSFVGQEWIGILALVSAIVANIMYWKKNIIKAKRGFYDLRQKTAEFIIANPIPDLKIYTAGIYILFEKEKRE